MPDGQDYWESIFGRPAGETLLDPESPLQLTPQKEEPPTPGITPWENIFGRPPDEPIEPIKKETFLSKALGKIGGFVKKETLPFLLQDPGIRRALMAGVEVPEKEEEERPLPTIGPVSPEHVKFVEKYGRQWEMATMPRKYFRIAQETWSRDPNVNYWSEKIAGKAVPIAMIVGIPEVAGYMALYELFQQMKNIGFAIFEKTKYDPLENRRLSEAIPGIKDAPWWVRLATDLGEMGLDIVAAAITGRAISFKAFKFGFNKWTKGMKKAGVDEETLRAVRAKFNEVGKDLSKFSGLNKNIKNVFAKFEMGPVISKETAVAVPGIPPAAAAAAGRIVPRVPVVPPVAAAPPIKPTLPMIEPAPAIPREAKPFIVTPKPEIIPPETDPAAAALAIARSGITPEIEAAPVPGKQTINIKTLPDGSFDITSKPEVSAAPGVLEAEEGLFKVQAADLAERLKAGAPPFELAREAQQMGVPVRYLPEEITEEGMAKRQDEILKRLQEETGREIKPFRRRETANYEVAGVGIVQLPVRVVSGRKWPKPIPYEWFRVLQYTTEGIKPIKGEEEEALMLDRRLKSRTGTPADEVADALGYEKTSELYAALELPRKAVPEVPGVVPEEAVYTEEEVLAQISADDVARAADLEREIARGVSEMEELEAMPEIEKKLTPEAKEFLDDFIAKQKIEIDREEVMIEAEKISIRNKNEKIMGRDVSEALDRQVFIQGIEELPELDLIQETAIPSLEKEPFKRFIYLGHRWFNENAKAEYFPEIKTHALKAVETNSQIKKEFDIDLYDEIGSVRSRDVLNRELRSLWGDREAKVAPELFVPPEKAPPVKRKPWPAPKKPAGLRKIVPKFGEPAAKQMDLVEETPEQLKLREEEEKVFRGLVETDVKKWPRLPEEEEPGVEVLPGKKLKPLFETKVKRKVTKVEERPEIPIVPKGRERLVKVAVETPLGDIEKLGEIPESRLKSIEAYAKKIGIEKKLKIGAPFIGKYGEILSPAQQEIFMKEVIRDAKIKAKEEWQKWSDPGDDIKDLYSGIPVLPEIKKYGAEISKWLQIEPQFKAYGADRTGLALKALHPRTNSVLLQAKGTIKKLIKEFDELSDSDWQRLLFITSAPRRHFGKMTFPERKKFGPAASRIRGFFDHWGRELEKKGVIEDLWPQSAIKYMQLEIGNYRAALKKRISNERGKKIRDTINSLEGAIEFLQRSGTKYVHIPKIWMQAWWEKDPIEGWKTLSEFFHQRKSLDLEAFAKKLLDEGKIKPTDLDIRRIMAAYAHQAGHKLALAEVFRAAKADRMILPADEAPETWQTLDPRRYPTLRGYKTHPALVHYFERNFFRQGFVSPKLGAFLSTVKMLQFYNPLFLPMYDAIQYFWGGMLSPWKTPSALRRAVRSMKNKDQHYWNMHYWVGFSTPFTPGFKQWDKQIKDIIYSKSINTRFKKLNPYRWSWELAWYLDNFIRMITYHHQVSLGMTPMEAAQFTAKIHADYASIPPATRRIINKILFTPSFRIAMISAQSEMVKNFAGLFSKAKKESQGGGKLPPGDLFEEPIDGSSPEGPGRSKRYKRAMAKALVGLLGGIALRELLMHKLGYRTDKFGLRYVKNVIVDGEEKELVQYMSSPDNVIMRYFHRFRTLANEPNKIIGFIDRAKWDFHPFWQLVYEVLANKDPAGDPIYRPGLDSAATLGNTILGYSIKRIFRMLEVVSEDAPGKRKIAIDAMYKDMGKMAHFFRWFTLPYLRNPAEKRMTWRMNFMVKEFNRLMREKPFKTEEEADKASKRMEDFLDKMMDDIEKDK